MRFLTSLLLAAACLAGVGCASKAPQEAAVASTDAACANDPSNSLHLTSQSSSQPVQRDAAIESILTQQTSDWRLAQINRSLYQSLRSLDAELRREERIAACERAPFGNTAMLSAQADNKSDGAAGSVSDSSMVVSSSAAAGGGVTRALRKTSMSSGTSGGGNGMTAPKYMPGSDNQIVAQRLKRAAEQETNPSLRAKLWKEYTDYVQGASAK
jgi:hypothetical protein